MRILKKYFHYISIVFLMVQLSLIAQTVKAQSYVIEKPLYWTTDLGDMVWTTATGATAEQAINNTISIYNASPTSYGVVTSYEYSGPQIITAHFPGWYATANWRSGPWAVIPICAHDQRQINNEIFCTKTIKYVVVLPDTNPPPQMCAGNPIEIGLGKKYQSETDVVSNGKGQISLIRYYSNSNISSESLWHHNYYKSLINIKATSTQMIKQKSNEYAQKSDACFAGWNDIKSRVSESWVAGANAYFVNNSCQIIRNNVIVKTLPILPTDQSDQNAISNTILLYRPNGATIEYQSYGASQFVPTNGDHGNLQYIDSTNVWRYTNFDGDIEEYSADGKLFSITAVNGVKQTLTYNAVTKLLEHVADTMGNSLDFAYANNQLVSITTNDNKTTSYNYNTLNLIIDVKRPDNSHRLYHYEDSRFPTYLTGITDESGVRFATWTYDAQGRGISSEHASGAEKTLLAFNTDGSTTVTNPLNKQTIYRFADIAGSRRVTSVEGQSTANCLGANQNYTYTPEGWVASKTDWGGNKTTYVYNTKGQETSRTEASGTSVAKTITTEWHPTLNLKTKITEPDNETTFSYDTNGFLLNQNTRSLP